MTADLSERRYGYGLSVRFGDTENQASVEHATGFCAHKYVSVINPPPDDCTSQSAAEILHSSRPPSLNSSPLKEETIYLICLFITSGFYNLSHLEYFPSGLVN